jgi:hypothetical protein
MAMNSCSKLSICFLFFVLGMQRYTPIFHSLIIDKVLSLL